MLGLDGLACHDNVKVAEAAASCWNRAVPNNSMVINVVRNIFW